MTDINNLPDELITHILERVTDYYKLKKCKTIAKNYKNLASDAIKNSNAKPPSKYKRGMIVRLTQKRVNEIKKACNNKWTGEMPFHNLIVYCDPHWNGNNWVYYYEYGWGGTSEGVAHECDIEQAPHTRMFK